VQCALQAFSCKQSNHETFKEMRMAHSNAVQRRTRRWPAPDALAACMLTPIHGSPEGHIGDYCYQAWQPNHCTAAATALAGCCSPPLLQLVGPTHLAGVQYQGGTHVATSPSPSALLACRMYPVSLRQAYIEDKTGAMPRTALGSGALALLAAGSLNSVLAKVIYQCRGASWGVWGRAPHAMFQPVLTRAPPRPPPLLA